MDGHVCPVCGEHVFEGENDFAMCPKCYWVNDSFQEEYPDISGCANVQSLNQFREAYGLPPVERNRGITFDDLPDEEE